jgi:hypothetical protein
MADGKWQSKWPGRLVIEFGGKTVIIPQGDANAEVRVEVAFEDLYLAAGQAVRWKVISAPDGEHTAWQANLSMAVQGVA